MKFLLFLLFCYLFMRYIVPMIVVWWLGKTVHNAKKQQEEPLESTHEGIKINYKPRQKKGKKQNTTEDGEYIDFEEIE